MFPLAWGGHDFKPGRKGDMEMITDLLSAELVLLPSMEGIRTQLGDKIILKQCRVAERSPDLDLGYLCLVFVPLVTT